MIALPAPLNLSVVDWVVSLAAGVALGAVVFLSMKAQVDYLLNRPGRQWLMPVLLLGRLLLVAAALMAVVWWVPRDGKAAAVIAGLAGLIAARIIVARRVRAGAEKPPEKDKDLRVFDEQE